MPWKDFQSLHGILLYTTVDGRNFGKPVEGTVVYPIIYKLGCGFKHFLFSPVLGEDFQFD